MRRTRASGYPSTRVTIHYSLPILRLSDGVVGKAGIIRGIIYFWSVVCRARGESLEAQPLECE